MEDSSEYKSKIKQKDHFVYKWVNNDTNEYYIGKHSGTIDDGYIGSGKLFLERFLNTDNNSWVRHILGYYPSSNAALEQEKLLIGELYDTDPLCLNLIAGGSGGAFTEKSIKPAEYKKLREKKINQKSVKYTLGLWAGHIAIDRYIYVGQNMQGKTKIFNETPAVLKNFIKVALEVSKIEYPYEFLEEVVVIMPDATTWTTTPNYIEIINERNWQKQYNIFYKDIMFIAETINDRTKKK